MINGQWHRLCPGASHDQPTFLPENDKYFLRYKSGPRKGRFIAQCRLCRAWAQTQTNGSLDEHGFVPVAQAAPIFLEAANRIGIMELSRRTGIVYEAISRVIRRRQKYVRRSTVKKVLLELVSIKRKGEFSISPLAAKNVVKRGASSGFCVGCGTPLDNYTIDCEACQERKRKRKVRLTEGSM